MKPTAAILSQAYAATGARCLCPTCLRLDARYPTEGYQLAFWPWRPERVVRERLR
jgi:hypothetical protein